jgi:hypothetical protein
LFDPFAFTPFLPMTLKFLSLFFFFEEESFFLT